MKFEVLVHIEGDTSLEIEADSAEQARKIALGLEAEIDILFPPESVYTSAFDRGADLTIDGVTEIEEPVNTE